MFYRLKVLKSHIDKIIIGIGMSKIERIIDDLFFILIVEVSPIDSQATVCLCRLFLEITLGNSGRKSSISIFIFFKKSTTENLR